MKKEIILSEDQRKELEKLWFVFGNGGWWMADGRVMG